VELTPEQIERFRQIGLRLDRAGRLWHQGEEVTHAGLRRAILGWLDVLPDGRDVVRLDATRYAYVDVEDAHLRATSLRWEGERGVLTLDDGHEAPLDPATLTLAADGAAYVRVRDGRLRARLTTAAHQHLAPRLREVDGRAVAHIDGRDWPLAR
jgi:hypothetical protein